MPENKQPTPSIRRHRPFYKLPLFWFTLIIVLLAGAFAAQRVIAAKKKSSAPESSGTTTSQTTETIGNQSSEKSQGSAAKTENKDSDGKTPSQYDGSNPNEGGSLTGSLTTARFDGGKLILRVSIDQYLASGTCNLEISDGANKLQKSANISPIASTSSCEGFDVLDAELSGFAKPMDVKITLSSGDKSGVIEGKVE